MEDKIAVLTETDRLGSWWVENCYSEIKWAGVCGIVSNIKATIQKDIKHTEEKKEKNFFIESEYLPVN